MDLDAVTVNIRPRNPWEAIDVGFLLARQNFLQLWLLWLLSAGPFLAIFTGIGFLLPGSAPKWGLMLFWLCKPCYEPAMLIWISEALFNENGTTRETVRKVRKEYASKRAGIFFSRFNLYRSFCLPVILLEGLEGKRRKDRLSILQEGCDEVVLLTIGSCCIEVVLTLSLMTTVYWFVPEELRWVDFGKFIFQPDKWLVLFSYIMSCALFAPFYICSGFMMYISRRVKLEAWDIEIGFRKIRQRLQGQKKGALKALAILIGFVSFFILSAPSQAVVPDPETAHITIKEVMNQKDFGQKVTKYHWVPIKKEMPEKSSVWSKWLEQFFKTIAAVLDRLSPMIARPAKVFLWLCFIILLAYLVLRYSRLRSWLFDRLVSDQEEYKAPDTMFGMDLRPESLPEDIIKASLELLKKGNRREAMSLLYRGTLSFFINNGGLQIHSSNTEAECCREVKRKRSPEESVFFAQLTSCWVNIAYGHQTVAADDCRTLIGKWQNLFGADQS